MTIAYGGLPFVRPVVEISKDKVTFVSAFVGCDTCNSTGYTMGYWCTECGEMTNSIESEILAYSFKHPYPCNATSEKPTNEAWTCDLYGCDFPEGSGSPMYSISYIECGHSTNGMELPGKQEYNCPDCDIAYVYEDPEGGK